MKIRWYAVSLAALLLGLAALIVFLPSQRWWSPSALLCLGCAMTLYRENQFKEAEAKMYRVEDKGVAKRFWIFVSIATATILINSLVWKAGWWTLLTLVIGGFAFILGYCLNEAADEEAAAIQKRAAQTV